eukprot:scaffold6898_cov123-Cylindrotheca_fusiformis.AAC.9
MTYDSSDDEDASTEYEIESTREGKVTDNATSGPSGSSTSIIVHGNEDSDENDDDGDSDDEDIDGDGESAAFRDEHAQYRHGSYIATYDVEKSRYGDDPLSPIGNVDPEAEKARRRKVVIILLACLMAMTVIGIALGIAVFGGSKGNEAAAPLSPSPTTSPPTTMAPTTPAPTAVPTTPEPTVTASNAPTPTPSNGPSTRTPTGGWFVICDKWDNGNPEGLAPTPVPTPVPTIPKPTVTLFDACSPAPSASNAPTPVQYEFVFDAVADTSIQVGINMTEAELGFFSVGNLGTFAFLEFDLSGIRNRRSDLQITTKGIRTYYLRLIKSWELPCSARLVPKLSLLKLDSTLDITQLREEDLNTLLVEPVTEFRYFGLREVWSGITDTVENAVADTLNLMIRYRNLTENDYCGAAFYSGDSSSPPALVVLVEPIEPTTHLPLVNRSEYKYDSKYSRVCITLFGTALKRPLGRHLVLYISFWANLAAFPKTIGMR